MTNEASFVTKRGFRKARHDARSFVSTYIIPCD